MPNLEVENKTSMPEADWIISPEGSGQDCILVSMSVGIQLFQNEELGGVVSFVQNTGVDGRRQSFDAALADTNDRYGGMLQRLS